MSWYLGVGTDLGRCPRGARWAHAFPLYGSQLPLETASDGAAMPLRCRVLLCRVPLLLIPRSVQTDLEPGSLPRTPHRILHTGPGIPSRPVGPSRSEIGPVPLGPQRQPCRRPQVPLQPPHSLRTQRSTPVSAARVLPCPAMQLTAHGGSPQLRNAGPAALGK